MKFPLKNLFVLVLLCIINNLFGQNDSLINDLINRNSHLINYDSSFSGEGWDKIIEAAHKHNYFLIGEDHGFVEIPRFAQKLNEKIHYDLFVTEIDSITASIAKQLLSSDEKLINDFHHKNPSALSFFSAEEEFELLKQLASSGADIWGLDQVSLFSTGIAFKQLEKVCNNEKSKKLAKKLADLSDSLFNEAARTGNYDTLFIFSSKQEVFDNLREVIKNENQAAKDIVYDIEQSWKIYNGIDKANHFTRISGMKSYLLYYYTNKTLSQTKYNKVLYKFGAIHAGKDQSPYGGFDVGNFASNLADTEKKSSYHLMIVGKKGQTNTFMPTNGMNIAPSNMEEQESELYFLMPFTKLVGQEWVFFDLKPIQAALRKGKIEIKDSFLRAIINGYDGLVIIPEVTPSKIIKR